MSPTIKKAEVGPPPSPKKSAFNPAAKTFEFSVAAAEFDPSAEISDPNECNRSN